jgi:sialate O-acetylesterase
MTTTTTQLPGACITQGPRPWQVLQRDAAGAATVTLAGVWAGEPASIVEVRVAREFDNAPAAGCDWQAAEMLPEQAWQATLRVPTGGLYRLETRLRTPGAEWRLTGEKIWHVAVGDLWVIAGQSNAVGYGHGPVVDPPALGVALFGGDEQWRLATHPLFDPTGTRHAVNRDSGWVDVSPWLAFGKVIWQEAGVPVGLIPTALGGSPLWRWDPGDPQGADLYDNMRDMIAVAGGQVAGMVWYQGCSDTGGEAAETYLARFTRFVEHFRALYGPVPIVTAQLNRHFDAVPEGARGWALVREAQRRAARTIPDLAVVPTLDLPLSDAIHTSAVGNVTLGERFGRAALGLVYGQAIPWRAVDVREACWADAAQQTVRLIFDHVVDHLVFLQLAPQDFLVEDGQGMVPVTAARVEEPDVVVLELGRPAGPGARCHNMYGGNPPSSLRDHLQRPVLAFSGLPIR